MSKKIVCSCHEPIGISKDYEQPWSDTYLSWTGKPGRKKYGLAPTLIGKQAAIQDYKISCWLLEKYPDVKDYQDEKTQLESIIRVLEEEKTYVIIDVEKDLPTVYTYKDYINRKEAENMISELMKFKDYYDIKCKWKRVKIYVIPT